MYNRIARIKKQVLPLAVYGLISLPLLWMWSIATMFSREITDWVDRNDAVVTPITQAWAVTTALAMFVALIAAIYVLAKDDRISAESRLRWILALVFTNMLGGCLFLVWQSRKGTHESQGEQQ